MNEYDVISEVFQTSLLHRRKRALVITDPPSFARPDSQLVTASQIYEPECQGWMTKLFGSATLDRKCWEYSFILQALHTYCCIGPNARGLVFGCGKEMIPSVLAAEGCFIQATDLVNQEHGWEAKRLEDLHYSNFIDAAKFRDRVQFRDVNMNDIPDDLRNFDFCWSTGSLEHIGGHSYGLQFVMNAMKCLRPGGIAVHTTEFTISSDAHHFDSPELSFYCKKDIVDLASKLMDLGHLIVLNFERGKTAADWHVDTPPFHYGRTLAAHFQSHVITSIGLIIQNNGLNA